MTSAPDRLDPLLEGEDPQTEYARDARHWIALYREMITFNRDLLERVGRMMPMSGPASRREAIQRDLAVIEEQMHRYERRIEYWTKQQWELEGLHLDPETRTLTWGGSSIKLTKRELQLLVTLVEWSPHFLNARRLLVEAWHDSALPEETLRTYIVRLRLKLSELGLRAELINRPRQGYALIFGS